VLGEIFQTLAGGKKKEWVQTDKGPVATYRDLQPGEMARGILAAAITGLASGYDPANRGKGPAMASAFSAGFRGEEESREKQAGTEKQEAQQMFTNKNLSEELALKKAANARAQQESILNMQHTQAQINDMLTRASQEKVLFSEGQQDRLKKQMDDWDEKTNTGYQEIPHPEKPGETFGFVTAQQAQDALKKYPQLILRPGDFNTIVLLNPATGKWTPLIKPKDYDEKVEVRFAKMKPDGTPEIDKNGDYVPSGYRGPDGEIMQPQKMTGREYAALIHDNVVTMKESAEAKKYLADAQKAEFEMHKEKDLMEASNRMYAAGNDPWKVNTDTLLPYMNEQDRVHLHTAAALDASRYQTALNNDRQRLQSLPPDSEDANQIRADLVEEQAGLDKATQLMKNLSGRIDRSRALAKSFAEDHMNESGAINESEAKKAFEDKVKINAKTAGYSSQEIDNARAYLQKMIDDSKTTAAKKKAATTTPLEAKPPAPGLQMSDVDAMSLGIGTGMGGFVYNVPGMKGIEVKKAVDDLNTMNSPGQRAAYINKLNAPEEAKAMLRKASSATEAVPVPRKVMMLDTDGKPGTVDEKDVDMYLKQGFSIPPAGYKPQAQ
jgi:hypothetical protein